MNLNIKLKEKAKLKKIVAYGISGVITTLISIGTFKVFLNFLDYILAFTFSWILAVTFAFVSTRKSVYDSNAKTGKEKSTEYIRFIIGRVITYIINLLLLMLAVEVLELDEFYSNVIITVIIIILNYFVGDVMINKLRKRGKRNER